MLEQTTLFKDLHDKAAHLAGATFFQSFARTTIQKVSEHTPPFEGLHDKVAHLAGAAEP
jgi:hypothetical protein